MVNEEGKIAAITDWEESSSNIAPLWDFSIALYDLSIDEKKAFVEGYGMAPEEIREMSMALKAFNTINYLCDIENLTGQKQKDKLKLYKLRLMGILIYIWNRIA